MVRQCPTPGQHLHLADLKQSLPGSTPGKCHLKLLLASHYGFWQLPVLLKLLSFFMLDVCTLRYCSLCLFHQSLLCITLCIQTVFLFWQELSMESGIDPGQEYYGQDYYSYEHGYIFIFPIYFWKCRFSRLVMFIITTSNLKTYLQLRITLIFVSTKACADNKTLFSS